MTNERVLRLLMTHANSHGLKVGSNDQLKWRGAYYPGLKRVELRHLNEASDSISVLAHEIGHHYDYLKCKRAFYGSRSLKTALRLERVAWSNARRTLEWLGFEDWAVFGALRRRSLRAVIRYRLGTE